MQEPAAQRIDAADTADAPTLTSWRSCADSPRKGDPAGQQSAGETVLNEMLRAINRSGIGRRDVAGGAGEAAQEGSQGNGGGAMGRRVGTSRAGSGTASLAAGNPAGAIRSGGTGDKTVRLEARLQIKVGEPRRGSAWPRTPCRAKRARQPDQLRAVAAARARLPGAVSGERTPLTIAMP